MDNTNIPQTERRFYQQIPLKNEWITRNNSGSNFYPQEFNSSSGLKTYYDDEGVTNISHTISAVRKPTLNINSSHIQNFHNFNTTHRPVLELRKHLRSNKKNKVKKTLRQSIQAAYNSGAGMLGSTLNRFGNMNFKRRKQSNPFNEERTIDFTIGGNISHSLMPKGSWAAIVSPTGSVKGSTPRGPVSHKKTVENIVTLKRTIRDLRELLKERDSEILSQKMSINLNKINNNSDDRDLLLKEVKRLKDYITKIVDQKEDSNKAAKEEYERNKAQLEELKAKLIISDKSMN